MCSSSDLPPCGQHSALHSGQGGDAGDGWAGLCPSHLRRAMAMPGSWAAALKLSVEHPGNEVIYPPFTDACLELARLSWLLVELVEDGCHI